jgi:hypothetical protein
MRKIWQGWSKLSVKDFFSGLSRKLPSRGAEKAVALPGEPAPENPPRKIEDFKRPLAMEDHAPRPEPLKSEEDVIFPPDNAAGKAAPRASLGIFKLAGFVAALAAAYYLGSASNPESMKFARENLEKLMALAIEKSGPTLEKFANALDSQRGHKTELPRLPEGSETKSRPPEEGSKTGAAPTPEPDKTEPKIKYWHDPMIPGYRSDKPGKSPMGMEMIPVYEEEEDEERPEKPSMRIPPNMAQNIGLRTEPVREMDLAREIRTIGRLTYDERKLTFIHTKYEGWIEHLYVNFTGQEVQENDLLIDVYSPELVSTQEEMLLALKYHETVKDGPFPEISQGAQNLLDATRRRLELFDVPEHQIEELLRNKKISKTMHIHSPARGVVINRGVTHGMYVKPDMHLYTIADISNIWALADIFEYELPWVKVGQDTEMQLSYFPGKKFRGKITFIDPFLDPKTRTVKVRMEFANPQWKLKPDMYANVTLRSPIAGKSIAVPEEAVIHAGDKNIAIVQNRDGGFESREVAIGMHSGKHVQILSGLKPGETVVTSANFLFDAESKLSEALKKLQPPPAVPTPEKPGEGG